MTEQQRIPGVKKRLQLNSTLHSTALLLQQGIWN